MIRIIFVLAIILFSTSLAADGEYTGTFLKRVEGGYDTKPHKVAFRFGEKGFLALKDNKWNEQVLVDPNTVGIIGIEHTAYRDLRTGYLAMQADPASIGYMTGILIFTTDKILRGPKSEETYKSGDYVDIIIREYEGPKPVITINGAELDQWIQDRTGGS